ncbi:hypothetical protein B7R54_13045 [Subtercola boreus]|uniref:ER-bound oxygenase mpaB/mpaB'/Rubber oxygenase catalytic domain-containing protein n=1 Tax=Subtercola boreus TaxID=120213 RepID=A0A3E0VKL4_9MICO|nr:oxygenase MpaB family protein [Subtercola boreus]RFA10028.1 hypothetical protein B7R54_13045 [Subtercola boreus]TQL52823.1 uncharacterized protein (DUF2236 family) [Subtercola boreus]
MSRSPYTVFTNLAAEAVLLAGGGRAILMQIANPAVGYGVAAHSDFANRPLERLANTVTYAYATVFASPAELAAVVARVNRAHAPVVSRPGEPGERPGNSYNAFDSRAQLWVAATLYQTALTVYEKTFGPLAPEDAEVVYQRYGVLGSALQMPAGMWPADLTAFRAYWMTAVSELRVTDPARRVAHDLLHPRTAPLWLRAAMPLVRLVTTGLLDDDLRRAFVLPWSSRSQRRFDRLFRVAAIIYPRLPRRLRQLPRDRYLKALRASL